MSKWWNEGKKKKCGSENLKLQGFSTPYGSSRRFHTRFYIVIFIRNATAVKNAECTQRISPLLQVTFADVQTRSSR